MPHANADIDTFTPENISFVEIFPPIGIARVGNSGTIAGQRRDGLAVEYFLGPEVPLGTAQPAHGFRDKGGRIKRQAVKYRVYAYNVFGRILGELTNDDGYQLEWTVDVANCKAATTEFRGRFEEPTTHYRNPDIQPDLPQHQRTKLIVKPPAPITVSGVDVKPTPIFGMFQGSRPDSDDPADPDKNKEKMDLGDVLTDAKGRLIFVGGAGWACCVSAEDKGYKPDAEYPTQPDIMSEFDNIDWIDDTCDGYISVKWSHEKSPVPKHARHKAYVLTGPPNFAWGINPPTTLWDVVEDMYNKASKSFAADSTVQFYRDIWPVMDCTYNMSWTNKTTFQGHGPNGKGNFLPLREKLMDNSDKDSEKSSEKIAKTTKENDMVVDDSENGEKERDKFKKASHKLLRQHVFDRLRMPDLLNPDQATVKYMPRLAGDGGELIAPGTIQTTSSFENPISQFSALTALQYQRFKHWAAGNFETDPYPGAPPPGKLHLELDDVPLDKQPEYLSRAQLESAVGDPTYPGIETTWIAKQARTYHMEHDSGVWPPFRINERTIRPGDMTKQLSLPWQSDFGQCNTIWWPASRPDDVVPEVEFEAAAGKKPKDSMDLTPEQAGALPGLLEETTRRRWTEPMRLTPNNASNFFPGCTDMVRHWQQLGFIARVALPGDAAPVFVEVERRLPERPPAAALPNAVPVRGGTAAGGDVAGKGVGGVGTNSVVGGSSVGEGMSGAKRGGVKRPRAAVDA